MNIMISEQSGEESVTFREPAYGEYTGELSDTVEPHRTFSPDEEWFLASSIKYQLVVEGRPIKSLNVEPLTEDHEPPASEEALRQETPATNTDEEEEYANQEWEGEVTETQVRDSEKISDLEAGKIDPMKTVFIPEVEWLLIPSIKYGLLMKGEKVEDVKASSEKCENIQIPPNSPEDEAAFIDTDGNSHEWLLSSSIKYGIYIEARRSLKMEVLRQKCLAGDEESEHGENGSTAGRSSKMGGGEEEESAGEMEEASPPIPRPLRDLEELRWFAEVLNTAHRRRPRFVPAPRESVKEMRKGPLTRPITVTFQSLETRRKMRADETAAVELAKSQSRALKLAQEEAHSENKNSEMHGENEDYEKRDLNEDAKTQNSGPIKEQEITVLTAEVEVSRISQLSTARSSDNTDDKVDDYPCDMQDLKEVFEELEKAWRESPASSKLRSKDRILKKSIMVRSALLAARMSLLNIMPGAEIGGGDGEKRKAHESKKKSKESKEGDTPFTAKVLGQNIDVTFN